MESGSRRRRRSRAPDGLKHAEMERRDALMQYSNEMIRLKALSGRAKQERLLKYERSIAPVQGGTRRTCAQMGVFVPAG